MLGHAIIFFAANFTEEKWGQTPFNSANENASGRQAKFAAAKSFAT